MPLAARIDHDSPLGRWRLVRWAPAPQLSGFVRRFGIWRADGAYTRERIPPRTHFDLLINLGERTGC